MTDKLTNSANAYIGAAKQAIGNTFGNPTLAASGAQQQAQAEAAQNIAHKKTHAKTEVEYKTQEHSRFWIPSHYA
ncbi:hypothetical protein FBU30_008041 [Linnemannia zychae]|nr:hypothetical protein FBU30_008041 [Linnemannia zychae]